MMVESSKSLSSGSSQMGEGVRREREFVGKGEYREEDEGGREVGMREGECDEGG